MYTYLFSMILSHISLQNYFENFPKFKNFPIKKSVSGLSVDRAGRPVPSRPGRSTAPVDRALCLGRARFCARLSVDRPVGRLKAACSLCLAGRPSRSTGQAWKGSGRPALSTARPETVFDMGYFLNFGNFSNKFCREIWLSIMLKR